MYHIVQCTYKLRFVDKLLAGYMTVGDIIVDSGSAVTTCNAPFFVKS